MTIEELIEKYEKRLELSKKMLLATAGLLKLGSETLSEETAIENGISAIRYASFRMIEEEIIEDLKTFKENQ